MGLSFEALVDALIARPEHERRIVRLHPGTTWHHVSTEGAARCLQAFSRTNSAEEQVEFVQALVREVCRRASDDKPDHLFGDKPLRPFLVLPWCDRLLAFRTLPDYLKVAPLRDDGYAEMPQLLFELAGRCRELPSFWQQIKLAALEAARGLPCITAAPTGYPDQLVTVYSLNPSIRLTTGQKDNAPCIIATDVPADAAVGYMTLGRYSSP